MKPLSLTVQIQIHVDVVEEGSVYLAACAALLLGARPGAQDLSDLSAALASPAAAVASLLHPEALLDGVPGIRYAPPSITVEEEGERMSI